MVVEYLFFFKQMNMKKEEVFFPLERSWTKPFVGVGDLRWILWEKVTVMK